MSRPAGRTRIDRNKWDAADLDKPFGYNPHAYTAEIWNAVVKNNYSLVHRLIKNGYNIEKGDRLDPDHGGYNCNKRYSTPLCQAVDNGNEMMVLLLLQNNAKTIPSDRNYTPLHRAARLGLFRIVDALLRHGNDEDRLSQLSTRFTNDSPTGGYTALHYAVHSHENAKNPNVDRFKTVQMLIEYGANVFALDMYGENALSTVDLEISRETRSAKEYGYPLGESSISHMQVKELLEKTMEVAVRLRLWDYSEL